MKSGVDDVARPLPGGGGGINSIGDSFRPNLAMGGGSYRIPFELPHGPGGATPKLEIVYNTGLGTGPFGVGWSLAVPFIERRRPSPFTAPGEESFSISGSEPLIAMADGSYASESNAAAQRFTREGDGGRAARPISCSRRSAVRTRPRVSGEVDGQDVVARWLLDTVTFPNGIEAHYEYERVDGEVRLAALRWSIFRIALGVRSAPRPDRELRGRFRGATVVAVHGGGAAPRAHRRPGATARRWKFEYTQAAAVGTTLLQRVTLSGFHTDGNTEVETSLAPITFGYTEFTPGEQRIQRFGAKTVPPPPLGDTTTLFDYRGTSLPGVLQMSETGATWWENRGDGSFGAPEPIRALPAGISVGDDGVRFADMTGNGTADLLMGGASGSTGALWWEHDPALGFTQAHDLRLAPGFNVTDESMFVDLDGDGIVDLLVLDDRAPLGFFNDRGRAWIGPVVLPWGDAPAGLGRDQRFRLADMNGDGQFDLVLLRSRGVTYYPGLGGGRFGAAVEMEDTPDFALADPDRDVLLADVDGDGTTDLILLGADRITVHLNRGGRAYGEPIELGRTPRLNGDRVLTADMAGSGCSGLLWAMPQASGAGGYLYLDLLGGQSPTSCRASTTARDSSPTSRTARRAWSARVTRPPDGRGRDTCRCRCRWWCVSTSTTPSRANT